MPLQLRRGTNAEKNAMTQPLASGEPLWITDDKRLYIGDGVTPSASLSPVTGFTAEDAQDAAAALFTSGSHVGITFTYDDANNRLVATVNPGQLSGTIEVEGVIGSIFGNDSTLLVNASTSTIPASVVTGTFTGSVVGNVSGNVIGDLTGNVFGNLVGDIKGSVFADDSTVIVDSTNNLINTSTIISLFSTLDIGRPESPVFTSFYTSDTAKLIDLHGISDGSYYTSININVSAGTVEVPVELTTPLGLTGGINLNTYAGGTYTQQTSLLSRNSVDSDYLSIAPGGDLLIQVADNTEYNYYVFNHDGVFTTPALQVFTYVNGASYTGEIFTVVNGRPEPTPTPVNAMIGTIIFDSDQNKFKGYTTDSDNAGTPGWQSFQMGDPIATSYTTATKPVQAAFTAVISGTTLTVTGVSAGHLRVGMEVFGASVLPSTFILEDLGGGDWRVNNSQVVSPGEAMTGPVVNVGTIIFVSDATSGNKFQGWDGSSWVSLG